MDANDLNAVTLLVRRNSKQTFLVPTFESFCSPSDPESRKEENK